MSCADSVLLASSSKLVHDLWCGALKHEIKPENELKASRLGVLIIGVLGIVLALFAQNIISVMQLMATPFVGSIFPIVLAMFFWKKVTNKGAVCTIIAGLVMFVITGILKIDILGQDPSFVTVVVCTVVLIVSSLLTQEKKEA